MIKRIACLATLQGDTREKQYSELVFNAFDSARVYNRANHINGAFLIRDNTILQVLEGEPDCLATLMYHINRNAFITSATVILNSEISAPAFTRWSIKMLNDNSANNKAYTQKLLALMTPDIKILSKIDRHRFNYIFDIESQSAVSDTPLKTKKQPDNPAENPFKNKTLFMSSWPSPTKLRLNAPLMKLSSVLIGHNVYYQRLIDLQVCEHEQELTENLQKLYNAGVLNIKNITAPNNVAFINHSKNTPRQPKSSHRFSQALKRFIGSQKPEEMP